MFVWLKVKSTFPKGCIKVLFSLLYRGIYIVQCVAWDPKLSTELFLVGHEADYISASLVPKAKQHLLNIGTRLRC